jgi:hypothetical protein
MIAMSHDLLNDRGLNGNSGISWDFVTLKAIPVNLCWILIKSPLVLG